MTALDRDRWLAEADTFVRRFAERAERWDVHPGDLEDGPAEPWTDPDHPDERLDAAYRSGIVPPELRGFPVPRPQHPHGDTGSTGKGRTNPCDAALRYASRGMHVFPLDDRNHPLVSRGFYSATTNPGQIGGWWQRRPDARIGFWPGPSDIAVLDIDMKNGKNGRAAVSRLDCPILPATPTVHTPNGGLHLHFVMPERRITVTTGEKGCGVAPGLDWRGDGGYAVLPSPGSGYRWGRWHYGNCSPVPVPSGLMPRKPAPRPQLSENPPPIHHGSLAGVLRGVLNAKEGERNSLLYWSARRYAEAVSGGHISEPDARSLLLGAAQHCGLYERDAAATIASAFRGAA